MRKERARRLQLAAAGAAGTAVRWLGWLVKAAPGVAGAGLASYGAWLAWSPAGFMTAGGLVLADVVASRITRRTRDEGDT
ncbi:hypothetical protein ACFY3G_17825 [Streptomyces phaeochromogenes]|uniref:hypothetical protein n=1 Tax=Streptomyces phaeochromogenes TaxID=1923 RepID=UPI003693A3BC